MEIITKTGVDGEIKQLSQCAYEGYNMSWNEAWVLQIKGKKTCETASRLRLFFIIHVVQF